MHISKFVTIKKEYVNNETSIFLVSSLDVFYNEIFLCFNISLITCLGMPIKSEITKGNSLL